MLLLFSWKKRVSLLFLISERWCSRRPVCEKKETWNEHIAYDLRSWSQLIGKQCFWYRYLYKLGCKTLPRKMQLEVSSSRKRTENKHKWKSQMICGTHMELKKNSLVAMTINVLTQYLQTRNWYIWGRILSQFVVFELDLTSKFEIWFIVYQFGESESASNLLFHEGNTSLTVCWWSQRPGELESHMFTVSLIAIQLFPS